jgi:phosphoribosylanthranilate isomerase
MIKVKVCGLTSYDDAMLALDSGADALGFNFFPKSPRYIAPERARAIIERLPALSAAVGVFVNEPDAAAVVNIAGRASVGVLQLHGDETPEYCRSLGGWPVIKVLRVDRHPVADALGDFCVRAFLLDARDDSAFGGTGRTFDWSMAEDIKRYGPVIVAGGLKPENVGSAIAAVHPYGVDVCSGVELAPGRKDPRRLREFIREVRKCE